MIVDYSQMAKSHRNGHVPKLDWLDRLSFREMELINEKEKRESQFMYLMVEFPEIISDGENVSSTHPRRPFPLLSSVSGCRKHGKPVFLKLLACLERLEKCIALWECLLT